MLVYKSLSAAERDKADAYAGPGKSFPLYRNGEHLAAAWDLAGHGADKEAIRAKILSFAREHGLTHHLPADAQQEEMAKKARNGDLQDLLYMAWQHESAEGDRPQMTRLAHWAKGHGVEALLPSEAHSTMHDERIVHHHDDVPNDEYGQHEHEMVRKAFASLAHKARLDNGDTVIEGWVSTPDPDLDKDIVEPGAFLGAMDAYASVGMPLSSEHNVNAYPVGHGQRVAVVENGQIKKSSTHPDDPAEFEHFPSSGSGVYGRFVITEPAASLAVYKGNVRGFSWIGKPMEKEPLPSGGSRIKRVEPWLESTIAAYPVNQRARVLAAQ